jgi:hypothetical protein
MNKKIKYLIYLFLFLFLFLFINYFIINTSNFSNLKNFLSENQRYIIKKYIFPYRYISTLENKIYENEYKLFTKDSLIAYSDTYQAELNFQISNNDIDTLKLKDTSLSNGLILKKNIFKSGFYSGIGINFSGSGYIDFYKNNIFVLSSRGVLAYSKNVKDNFVLKQIKNNISEFIGKDQYEKFKIKKINGESSANWFSIKDLLIYKNKIFVSFTDEIKNDCWNTSIIYGEINFSNIEFKKFFSTDECVHATDNIDGEFNAQQSGGRIIEYDEKHIALSVGEFRERHLAQNKNSINGKIIKINLETSGYEIISMGHRNPQGLYFDRENNFILSTEHGPRGGDEINLIDLEKINESEILNYGWPISSAGVHYKETQLKVEKYPLNNSHKVFGFIEPLKSFVPSIGISEITKIGNNKYVVSSMKEASLYFFELNNNKISNLKKVVVNERVRDVKFNNNKLYLFLENTSSLGVILLN